MHTGGGTGVLRQTEHQPAQGNTSGLFVKPRRNDLTPTGSAGITQRLRQTQQEIVLRVSKHLLHTLLA
ncbi:hypothetical protein D3C80_1699410 [compost metagenome]